MDKKNSQDPQGPLLDRDYDGIQEFDNPLPNWWLVTFFATIIFSFIYYIHYEFGGGPTLAEELEEKMKTIAATQKSNLKEDNESDLLALLEKPDVIENGKKIYTEKCAMCHGPEGQGLVGPNLTDRFWIQGQGKIIEIAKVIRAGVPEKGMPAWETQLRPEDLQSVAVRVFLLKGTQPQNPKAPQGVEIAQ